MKRANEFGDRGLERQEDDGGDWHLEQKAYVKFKIYTHKLPTIRKSQYEDIITCLKVNKRVGNALPLIRILQKIFAVLFSNA